MRKEIKERFSCKYFFNYSEHKVFLQERRAVDIDLTGAVLTKDSVTVSVDAVVYYRVNNATVSVANVENAHHSTRLLAQTTLRNMLGTKALHEILGDRESISNDMQTAITCYPAIRVERVLMLGQTAITCYPAIRVERVLLLNECVPSPVDLLTLQVNGKYSWQLLE
ncbi:hypothetical protein HAZT_HAZT004290 [Hyalella azteca]|uniref:Band 7 domain-containing protein n=1 Tax=Hyalella azteca TaxID=294128 RepID=A0A6A0H2E7_HYAAZ|nr:hypothetical protein HAZT_HAZT004290 [Hyalella azteca]